MRGDHKVRRPHQMRRNPHPGLALSQRGARAAERPALEHGKIALDQPPGRRGGRAAKVALFDQNDPQAASDSVAGHADAILPAADDRKIVIRLTRAPAMRTSESIEL